MLIFCHTWFLWHNFYDTEYTETSKHVDLIKKTFGDLHLSVMDNLNDPVNIKLISPIFGMLIQPSENADVCKTMASHYLLNLDHFYFVVFHVFLRDY